MLALVGLAAVIVVAAFVHAGAASRTPRTKRPSDDRSVTRTGTTASTVGASSRSIHGVGEASLVVTEPGKELLPPHSPDGSSPAPRQVRVLLLYPARTPSGSAPVVGAPPAAGAPFPLVIFGPGFDQPTGEYSPVLEFWAAHGFVVAAVTFPLTNPDAPGGPYRPDILNQPADMVAVANALVRDSATPSNQLYRLIDPREIGVSGQSDGGDTALALAYNTCCMTLPISAAVIMSGAELHSYGGFPGTFFPAGTHLPPLLAFQGTDDPVLNPPAYTNQYFAAAPEPKLLVCLDGADHLEAYTTTDAYESVVAQASTDFFDHYLLHEPGALADLKKVVDGSSVANFAGSCPLAG
jgi:dienelactone hydrolase